MTGCSTERIVRLEDTDRRQPVPNKTLFFTHGRDSWVPGADVPLFGPAVVTVKVPLDANGQAHIHLRRVLWWACFEEDQSRTGNCCTSIMPSDLRDGGVFRLYRPPPTIADTNVVLSKYVLRITKP